MLVQKVREDFYQALTEFGLCLKIALSSRSFYGRELQREGHQQLQRDLRFFINAQDSQTGCPETVDYSAYEEQIGGLLTSTL